MSHFTLAKGSPSLSISCASEALEKRGYASARNMFKAHANPSQHNLLPKPYLHHPHPEPRPPTHTQKRGSVGTAIARAFRQGCQ